MLQQLSHQHDGEGTVRMVPESDGILAVCLQGEFDVANAEAVRAELGAALSSGEDVILDLDETTFVDSSIIHVLFEGVRSARGRDQRLVLQLGSVPIVERALEISGVERVLARVHDRVEAVRALRHAKNV